MRILETFAIALVAVTLGSAATAQDPADAPSATTPQPPMAVPAPVVAPSAALRMMEDFKDTDVKFDINELVDILRDHGAGSAGANQVGDCDMSGVRASAHPAVGVVESARPGLGALCFGTHELLVLDGLLTRPHAAGAAEIGNA